MRSTFSRRYYFNETESQSRGNITKSKEIWRSLLLESSLERLAFCFLFFWQTKKINKCELYDCKKKKNRLFSCTEVISTYSLVALFAERFLVMLSVFIVPIVATTTGFCLELNNK